MFATLHMPHLSKEHRRTSSLATRYQVLYLVASSYPYCSLMRSSTKFEECPIPVHIFILLLANKDVTRISTYNYRLSIQIPVVMNMHDIPAEQSMIAEQMNTCFTSGHIVFHVE